MEDPNLAGAPDTRLEIRLPVSMRQALFGLVFALMPLGVLIAFAHGGAPAFALAVPMVFVAVGIGLALGRRGAIVDRAAGTVTAWWGLWVPMGGKPRPLGTVSHVSIGKEVRGGQKSRITVYPVRIVPDAGELLAPQEYEAARRAAEQIANYLGTGLHDSSSGVLVIREAGTLDEPLRDRLRRQGTEVPRPGPTPARFVVREQGEETQCVLPPAGIGLAHVAGLAGALLFIGVMAYFALDARPPWFVLAIAFAMGAIPLLLTVPPVVDALFGHDTVVFSERGVGLKPWAWLRRTKRIPVEQLEELVLVNSLDPIRWSLRGTASVWARSDRVTLHLGANLSAEEAGWLYTAVRHSICHSMFGKGSAPTGFGS